MCLKNTYMRYKIFLEISDLGGLDRVSKLSSLFLIAVTRQALTEFIESDEKIRDVLLLPGDLWLASAVWVGLDPSAELCGVDMKW